MMIKKHIKQATDSPQLAAGKKYYRSGLLSPVFRFRSSVSGLPSPAFRLRSLFAILIAAVTLSSCEDVIQVKLPNEDLNLIGVEAQITTRNEPTVFLYRSLRVDQNVAYPGISGAEVVIADDATPQNSIILTEDPGQKGFYKVPENEAYFGVPGRAYTLTIKTANVILMAKDTLARVEPIDSMKVMPSLRGNNRFLGVFTWGKEPAGIGNYYKWDIYVNDTLISDANRIAIASDEFVDGNYVSKLEIYTDFYQKSKEASQRKLFLNDTVQVMQTSISKFDYNFYFQVINQSNSGGLFSVPQANIKSNFTSSDGKPVLGIFTARDVSPSNKVVITQQLLDQLTPW
jgi:hypothetical protein